jgi:hypothetical protein
MSGKARDVLECFSRFAPPIFWLACFSLARGAFGETLVAEASKDNTLYEATGTQLSNGQGIFMFAGLTSGDGTRRALVAFNLAAIPTNATITGASLSLFLSRPRSDNSTETITLQKTLKDWGEGASNAGSPGGGGVPAQAGDATWLYNSFNTSFWAAPGGDFSSTISASTAVSTNNRAYTWSGSGMVADVQSWISNPSSNFGWLIRGDEADQQSAQRFHTSENTSNRPQLTVTYTVPDATPTPTPSASPSQLLNISTRIRVETGDNALIGGFIITGNAPKKVIIRAVGPSLAQFGLTDLLANPTLELRAANGSVLLGNNDWKDSQRTEIESSGVAPSNDLESAIITTLSPASYTAIVRGLQNTTGIGVVELYDLDSTADSLLANISSRGLVKAGNGVMIGGFIIGGGNASSRVILRAIGPSLSQLGVTNPLADPTLELRDANAALLASNDNWKDDPQAAEIAGLGVAPQNDLESALIATLPPGSSTGIVAGKQGAIGVALVEVYHLR